MPIVAHLVEKTESDGQNDVLDGVRSVLLAIDDAVDTTGALIQARAVTVMNANGFNLPTGYFDANRLVTGTWDAAGDITVVSGSKVLEVIA